MKVVPQNTPTVSPTGSTASQPAMSARDIAIAVAEGRHANSPVQQNSQAQPPAEVLQAQANASKAAPTNSQSNTIEAPTTTDTNPQSTQLDSQYAILARKEKQLRLKAQQTQQALADREAVLQAREAELTAKGKSYDTDYVSRARLKAEALQVLAEEGVSYDEITNQILNTSKTDPATMAMLQKLERATQELKDQQDAYKRDQEAATKSQYQEALNQIELDARRLVKADPNFEMISLTPGAVKEVVRLIEKTYAEDKVLLTVEEASELVENELLNRQVKASGAKKVQQRLQSTGQSKAAPQQQASNVGATTVKTLTNAVGSTRQMSAKERAIAAFKGELK